jgi:hypothetical protein
VLGLWKFIRRGCEEFSKGSRFKVGDGSKISFWHNVWCGERPFKTTFSGLYSIASLRDASVADHPQFSSGSSQWNANFVRVAHDWELEFFSSFFDQLYSIRLEQDGVDKLCWNPSNKRLFDVKLFYNILSPMTAIPSLGGVFGTDPFKSGFLCSASCFR